MFVRGHLTRQGGVEPRTLTFAVIDLATTGSDPGHGGRICEAAVVRMRGNGEVLDEYATLVDPEQTITHGLPCRITNADLQGAPTFAQIAGDLLAYLRDAIVVSHDLAFEEKFLVAELGGLGIQLSGVPGLCTLVTARRQLDRPGYRLDDLANLLTGERPAARHSALGDARAKAAILAQLTGAAPQPLRWLGGGPVPLPDLPRSRIIAPRAVSLRKGQEGWLATLTARLPYTVDPPPPREDGLRDYRALLAHALADRRIVREEAEHLAILAARAGLTQNTASQIHRDLLTDARARVEADGVVSPTELKELERAAKELGAPHLIADLTEAVTAARARRNGPLKGWRILPVGTSAALTEVVDLAVDHGARVAVNPTKTVRLVIDGGGAENDRRLEKARAAGIQIMTPEQARSLLESEIAAARDGLFGNPAGEAIAEQLAAGPTGDAPPAGPQWHTAWRPEELTPAQYEQRFATDDSDWDEWPPPSADRWDWARFRTGCLRIVLFMLAMFLIGLVGEAIRQLVE
ncbi:MAG TPA: 3'-5' exonuclease [Natronosporangium sp.]